MSLLREADLSWREVDGEIIVLDERTWRYLHLNGSAAVLWSVLTAGGAHDACQQALVDQFGIDPALADRDATAFLDDLRQRELLAEA